MKLSVTAHHNEYLPAEATTVDVIVTVRASGDAADAAAVAEVIVLDCSGSMGSPQAKMRAAQRAVIAAVDALPDGVAFAVVGGSQIAEMIYPADPVLATADESTRAGARRAVRRAVPHGGTAIGAWLRLARTLLTRRPATIGHAVLVTDGRNETETAEQLRAELDACAGLFTVDCRGIGSSDGVHDWDGAELLGIAEALGANPVVAVEDLDTLPDEVTHVLGRTLAAGAGDVGLVIRRSRLARVRFVKQVHPLIADLTARGDGPRYPIGAWSPGDRRDYHVALDVEPQPAGTRRRVAWFSATASSATASSAGADEADVTVEWTDDFPLYSTVHPTVAHYTGQQDLAETIRLGSAALTAGNRVESLRQFSRAVSTARAAGDTAKLDLLGRVVIADRDRVRFRDDADPRRLPPLAAGGQRTSAWTPAPIPSWQHCGGLWTERFCGTCGLRHDQVA